MTVSDFNNFSTSLRDEKRKTFAVSQLSLHSDPSSLSNINNFQKSYDQSSNQFRLDKSEKPSITDNSIPPIASTANNFVLLSPTTRKNNTISLSTISTAINSTSSSLESTTNSSTSSSRATINDLILLSLTTRKNNL
ncbi:unnamed protein product [Rotaria sordida]|uniref:Uncharacterized protein n=1 Tax=Rotaria sordida TaxID=392033 RepID=A0A814U0H8_9BILA|nr:unnamed protein product [Rotaria sordida]CAF1335510.1 unnamed protein product [Rotaria sordida]CAF3839693.1 unnamed protein product [Rotaria sordida]CAF4050451.1 unnamed protein product [Rotaria sordida]CAF4080047.1 unnamed protein product [Rotaria sordida]